VKEVNERKCKYGSHLSFVPSFSNVNLLGPKRGEREETQILPQRYIQEKRERECVCRK